MRRSAASRIEELVLKVEELSRKLDRHIGGSGPPPAPEFVSIKAAAHRTGVSESTMVRYAREHRLGSKPGGRWKIDVARLEAFLDSSNVLSGGHQR